jgi:hypothetical protein
MFNGTRHANRLSAVARQSLLLGMGIIFVTCGQGRQGETSSQSPPETIPPAQKVTEFEADEAQEEQTAEARKAQAVAPEKPLSIRDKVDACADLIELYTLLREARTSESTLTSEEDAYINDKWTSLLDQGMKPLEMCDEADLVASSFEGPEKEGERHTISMLFRVKQAFEKDRGIDIQGYVDPSHRQYLEESHRDGGYAIWGYVPTPATSQWKGESLSIAGGSYILIHRGVVASEETIPYNIKIAFFLNDDGATRFALLGERISLGWQVALGD